MYKKKKILGVILARGGSKRLKGKNIKALAGRPLIAWTIGEALASKYMDKLIVSTDDERIAGISRRCGAETPFMRPRRLATDNARSVDAVIHAIDKMSSFGERYDLVLLLQPTSPFRTAKDIDNAIRLLFLKNAKMVVSICKAGHDRFYRLNGAIYLACCDYLKRKKAFMTGKTFAYVMPEERSLDIDDEMDFKFAEFIKRGR